MKFFIGFSLFLMGSCTDVPHKHPATETEIDKLYADDLNLDTFMGSYTVCDLIKKEARKHFKECPQVGDLIEDSK